MSEIIFDRMGVITYPGFKDNLVVPLRNRGHRIGIWTAEPRGQAEHDIKVNGLSGLVDFIIGKQDIWGRPSDRDFEEMPGIKQAVERQDQNILSAVSSRIALSSPLDLERTTANWQQFLYLADGMERHRKSLTLVGYQSGILVESDHGDLEGRIWDSNHYQAFAAGSNYTLILIPEHPDVWERYKRRIQPETVIDELRSRLLTFGDTTQQINLGDQLGLY